MSPIKVLFVAPSFYPATFYGGPIYINRSFCEALAQHTEISLKVLTTDSDGPRRVEFKRAGQTNNLNYPITYCRRLLPPDIAPGLLLRLFPAIRSADVVHVNGVYSFSTLPALVLARLLGKPVVWSPLGALQRWQGSTRPRAKSQWEKLCAAACDHDRVLLHVTSDEERAESLERTANVRAIILRNGIDLPQNLTARQEQSESALRLLYVGRLHPIKGIENLLQALALCTTKTTLSICGEGDVSYENQLRSLTAELRLDERVQFRGRVADLAKEEAFSQADLCVVPSFKESFGTVVLESLARELPVIVGRGAPWKRVEEIGCGLWVSNEPAELAAAIDRAAKMPLQEMGRRGRAWVAREFSWRQVAEEMVAEYQRLVWHQLSIGAEAMGSPKAARAED